MNQEEYIRVSLVNNERKYAWGLGGRESAKVRERVVEAGAGGGLFQEEKTQIIEARS